MPAAPQRGAHARHHVRRRAGLRAAPVRRRPRGARRAGRPRRPGRAGRAGRGRGRAPPHRARAPAARVGPADPDARRSTPILQEVCEGIRAALGFANVSVELIDAAAQRAVPRAVVGWTTDEVAGLAERRPRDAARGCSTPSSRSRAASCSPATRRARGWASSAPPTSRRATAAARSPGTTTGSSSRCTTARAGSSASSGPTSPRTGSCPSTDRLQALRMFANQAATAVAVGAAFEEMQFLAENDPLTRVGNRRAFTRRLAEEVHRAARYGQRFALVVLDSTASRRSTTATATSRATWRSRRSATCCARRCAARTAPSAWAATSSP